MPGRLFLPLLAVAYAATSCGGGKISGYSRWDALKHAPTTLRLFYTLDVAGFGGVDFDFVAFVNEGRHLDY